MNTLWKRGVKLLIIRHFTMFSNSNCVYIPSSPHAVRYLLSDFSMFIMCPTRMTP